MNTSAIYTAMINIIYPVGTVIQNYNDSTDPGTKIPGTTWKRLEDTFLVGEGSFGTRNFNGGSIDNLSTGGEATVALTTDNLPEHTHEISFGFSDKNGGAAKDDRKWIQKVFEAAESTNYTNLTKNGTYETSTTGDNNYRHNNMPPYTRVYGWYRTA